MKNKSEAVFTFLIFILLVQIGMGNSPTCDFPYKMYDTLGCVKYYATGESWFGAQRQCTSDNGWLLIPYTNFIVNGVVMGYGYYFEKVRSAKIAEDISEETIWINAYRTEDECKTKGLYSFSYQQGDSWNLLDQTFHLPWESGEPNNCDETAIELYSDYSVNDENEDNKHEFFCQKMYKCASGSIPAQLPTVTCTLCSAGKYEQNGACHSCPTGKYNDLQGTIGESTCTLCPEGKYSDSVGQSACSECTSAPSKSPGATSCGSACENGYEWNENEQNCRLCEVGKYSFGGADCKECKIDFPDWPLSNLQRTACAQCPPNQIVPYPQPWGYENCKTCKQIDPRWRYKFGNQVRMSCDDCPNADWVYPDSGGDSGNSPETFHVRQFFDSTKGEYGECTTCGLGTMIDNSKLDNGEVQDSDLDLGPCVKMDGLYVENSVLKGIDYHYGADGVISPVQAGYWLNRNTFKQELCEFQFAESNSFVYHMLCGPSSYTANNANALITVNEIAEIKPGFMIPLLDSLQNLKDSGLTSISRQSSQIKRSGQTRSCDTCGANQWRSNCGGSSSGTCQPCKTMSSCSFGGAPFYLYSASEFACRPDSTPGDPIFADYECKPCQKFHEIDGEYFITIACGNSQNFERWDPSIGSGYLGSLPSTVPTTLCDVSNLDDPACALDSVLISDDDRAYESGQNKNLTFCPPGYFVDLNSKSCQDSRQDSDMQISACCKLCDLCIPPEIKSSDTTCSGSTTYQPYRCQTGCENGFYEDSGVCKACTSCLKGMVVP